MRRHAAGCIGDHRAIMLAPTLAEASQLASPFAPCSTSVLHTATANPLVPRHVARFRPQALLVPRFSNKHQMTYHIWFRTEYSCAIGN